jgi:hypothetical protein
MGIIVRYEPDGVKIFKAYSKYRKHFEKGWLTFLQKFRGHDNKVTKTLRKFNMQRSERRNQGFNQRERANK